ncbi:MAG: exodeoxyribonuclease III [Synergistaceae bacterium]|nr:exodeoxyribonuclease III [Synergistaceae bacterium]
MRNLRIATFNVNSVRSRIAILERWLADTRVDILFLQETKATDADFPAAAFKAMGYDAYFCGEKSYNGVAVIARASLTVETRFGFGDEREPGFPTRVAYAKITGGPAPVSILNTYVPQGKEITHPDYEVKKSFLERVRAFMDREAEPGSLFAWVGDLNVAPSEIDVTNPQNKKDHVCFHSEIREKFDWVVSWGLHDVLRRFRPEAGEFTFFDYRVKDALTRNIGWRIDHILATEALTKKAVDCYIDRLPRGWEKPSDHTPLVADFEV